MRWFIPLVVDKIKTPGANNEGVHETRLGMTIR